MTWKADAFLENLYKDVQEQTAHMAADQSRAERKAYLKRTLKELTGGFTADECYEPVLLERVVCNGYVRERVELSAVSGLSFAAYILIPDGHAGEKLPAVLAIHGHGYGSREIVGLNADGTVDEKAPGIHQHFALQLMRRGMVVIAPDIVGFGERLLDADLAKNANAPNSCYSMATQLLLHGKTLTGLRVTESLAALDYLAARPEVDSRRIGIMGFSGGGLIAYTAAVLDERLKAVAITGFTNTFKDSIMAVHHCVCNYTPHMLRYAELPEWISLIAPRPLFLESGANDPIFPAAGFARAAEQLRSFYAAEGAEDRLATDCFPGIHEISGRITYDWLVRTLKGL